MHVLYKPARKINVTERESEKSVLYTPDIDLNNRINYAGETMIIQTIIVNEEKLICLLDAFCFVNAPL